MLQNYTSLPRAVHLLCLGTFINRAGTLVVPFLTIYMRDALRADVGFAPVALGVFGLGSICGSVAGGHLADRVGRRPVMLAALLGSGLTLALLSQVTDATQFLAGVLIFALFGEAYRPAASAMIADLTTPEQRSHAFALMYVSINLGFAIGPAIGGAVAEYSFQWLFFGDALTSGLYALIIFTCIRETLARDHGIPATTHSESTLQEVAKRPQVSFAVAIRHMLRDRVFLTLCGASLLISIVYMQAMSTLPLYLDSLGLGPASYGRIIACNGLLIVLGQLPLTNWMHGKPRDRLLVAAALLTALGFGLHAVARSELNFVAAVLIWTLGEMMQFPHLPPIVTELAPTSMRARYMGVFGMCFSGASLVGAPLGGVVLQTAGPSVLWLSAAVLAGSAAALYAAIGPRIRRVSDTRAQPR